MFSSNPQKAIFWGRIVLKYISFGGENDDDDDDDDDGTPQLFCQLGYLAGTERHPGVYGHQLLQDSHNKSIKSLFVSFPFCDKPFLRMYAVPSKLAFWIV